MKQPFWRQQMPAIVIGLLDVFTIVLGMGVPVATAEAIRLSRSPR